MIACNFNLQIVFPIPEICEYLTDETKFKVFTNAERDDQVSQQHPVVKSKTANLASVGFVSDLT